MGGDENNVVRLHCSAFGYEHIFMAVAEKFNTKIHIAGWKLRAYADLPAVRKCLTSEGDSTRIHNCIYRVSEGGGDSEMVVDVCLCRGEKGGGVAACCPVGLTL